MESSNILLICVLAFLMVFLLLAVLAGMMRLIILILPEKKGAADAVFVAAVSAVMKTVYPNTRITQIEEKK